jgi:putative heme-binding domain-containing protein
VSGGDYGFREGTGKFPRYYPDSLPSAVDTGIGSPTGVKFGTGAKFPPKYQRALYAMDWSYGRILAVHLQPNGATYTGTFENFVVGKPLNVTDLEIGQDGAMYFTTGGRGTQSGLYRVTHAGVDLSGVTNFQAQPAYAQEAAARALRRKLEAFHGRRDPKAVDFAWPHLNSNDRWLRYAARIALESQPLELWQQRALDETQVTASLSALLALARLGSREVQNHLLDSLARHEPDQLSEEQKLEVLRIGSISFIRMGRPDSDTARDVIKVLDRLYPSSSDRLNRELCTVLVYLEAPGVVRKTMDLLAKATTQEEQLYYIFRLRTARSGWTMEDRKAYFSWFSRDRSQDKHPAETLKWFKDAGRDYGDGASFPRFMANILTNAFGSLSDQEHRELASLVEELTEKVVERKKTARTQRAFVKEWTMNDLVPHLDQMSKGRSFQKGKEAFTVAQCFACHRFGDEGGSVGPDITGAASRFNRRDLLETIIEPSKVISDQYQNITVTKKNGDDVTGRLVEDNEVEQKLVLVVNPLAGDRVEIKKSDVQKRTPSKVSPMPEGLVSILTKEEILDLLAYIESGGKRDHAAFRP